ncbi:MAG: hypothetical protein PVJ09_05435 [Candidatus Woesebacteria bacterium]|jgi:hypothetical protein
MQDINFLKNRLLVLNKFEKQDKKIFEIALIILIVSSVITAGLLSFRIFLNLKYKNILKTQKKLETEILSHEEIEESFLFFTNKLKLIKILYEKRIDKQKAINYINNLFGDDVFIEKMTFEKDGSMLILNIRSKSVFSLDKTFSLLESDEVKSQFKSLSKTDLKRRADGAYMMQLTLGLISTFEQEQKTTPANPSPGESRQ